MILTERAPARAVTEGVEMLHFWVRSYAKSTALTPSAAISLAAHIAIGGAAVYGTRTAASDAEVRRLERVVYYPPPDRQPGQRPAAERVHFVDVGAGTRLDGALTLDGEKRGRPTADETKLDRPGEDQPSQPMQRPIASTDSVFSILDVDETAARMEGSAAPVYPGELLKLGIEGLVVLRYVIDSTGFAEPASAQVMSSNHALFTRAVLEALPGMRFRPAMLNDHPVRELVEQSFTFRVVPPTAAPTEHTRTTAVP